MSDYEAGQERGYVDGRASRDTEVAALKARVLELEAVVDAIRAAGSPGTNWRWSIPANPDRDSDLILSASAEDVPRLADAVEALVAERDLWKKRCAEETTAWIERLREGDALLARLSKLADVWDEAAEATADWAERNTFSPHNHGNIDPPSNPYRVEVTD